jgi:hypothetical protein
VTALSVALVACVAIVAWTVRGLVARALTAQERLTEARSLAVVEAVAAARLADLEARFAAVEAESREVATRARNAGLGERLGRR